MLPAPDWYTGQDQASAKTNTEQVTSGHVQFCLKPHLLYTLTELAAYSRLTSQKTPFQPVVLQVLTNEVLSDLETMIRETNASVTVGELPTIHGDATQLGQLLQNLLTNALKFTKPGEPPQVQLTAALSR